MCLKSIVCQSLDKKTQLVYFKGKAVDERGG